MSLMERLTPQEALDLMAEAYCAPLNVQVVARLARAALTSFGLGAGVGIGYATGEARIGAARSARRAKEECMLKRCD